MTMMSKILDDDWILFQKYLREIDEKVNALKVLANRLEIAQRLKEAF